MSAVSLNKAAIFLTGILLTAPLSLQAAQPGRSVLQQADQLPADFAAHLFNVPLAVRVELNSQYLGDALLVLNQHEQIQLLAFTDHYDSPFDDAERENWLAQFSEQTALGHCTACDNQWLALEYSLYDSKLTILTKEAEQKSQQQKFLSLPRNGSTGLIIQNQLNLMNIEDASGAMYYNLEAIASTGNWTHYTGMQMSRSGEVDVSTYYGMSQLYSQYELQGRSVRAGYFANEPQGLNLRPGYGSASNTMLGLMLGSSDTLVTQQQYPSTTPVYVTAERPAIVEIYRNGLLINSQQVQAGLQAIDTTVLPVGIYSIQLRVVQDGQPLAESEAMIYKPTIWRDTSEPLRYSLFAGRQTQLFTNHESVYNGKLTLGATVNYLANASTVLGFSSQYIDKSAQFGISVDYTQSEQVKLLVNHYFSQRYGYGLDTQLIRSLDSGSLILSQQYNKREQNGSTASSYHSSTTLSWHQRLSSAQTTSLHLTHQPHRGLGADISWQYQHKLLGSDSTWRFAAFNRPAVTKTTTHRNSGFELTLNVNFGQQSTQYYGAIGNRTARDGSKENTAELGWSQQIADSGLKNIGAGATFDSYGIGLTGYATMQNQYIDSNLYMSRSSYDGKFSTGLNLSSSVVTNGDTLAASSNYTYNGASLMVELESDVKDLQLIAYDSNGQSVQLAPGRNVVPVAAYTPGTVSFDFAEQNSAYVSLSQSVQRYHLNKGGVDYLKLSAYRTLTVIGRLLDANGKPLAGQHILNHSSRTVTEPSGFFTLAMRESSPTLDVIRQGEPICHFELTPQDSEQQDVMFAGDMVCQSDAGHLTLQSADTETLPTMSPE